MKTAKETSKELPDWFSCVAEDVLQYCRPKPGLWVDLGCGTGGLGLALASMSQSTILLIDPDADALGRAVEQAEADGMTERVVPIVACAERIPLPDRSVDVVVSRGSIFFWNDPPEGLREVYRILRRGARALIGGGLGSSYPAWAREEFYRRRNADVQAGGAEAIRKWEGPRRPEWMEAQARSAGLYDVLIEPTPPHLWMLFEKDES
jgi:SAM-dependent methyltransferase